MNWQLDPVHTEPDPYGHHINLKSLKTSMTLKFVIILQNLIKAYHRKSGKSKYDRKLTELDAETTRIRSRVNGVLLSEEVCCLKGYSYKIPVNFFSKYDLAWEICQNENHNPRLSILHLYLLLLVCSPYTRHPSNQNNVVKSTKLLGYFTGVPVFCYHNKKHPHRNILQIVNVC